MVSTPLQTKNMNKISVYSPNLEERKDRKKSIEFQFKEKQEFSLIIVPAIKHEIGAYGLSKTLIRIVEMECRKRSDFFIFCEDDHVFTKKYNYHYLIESINLANEKKADLLLGGVSCMADPIQCTSHLFWVRVFNGRQFTVVYRRFYEKILNSNLGEGCITDFYLSQLSDNKFVMFPFISKQREFGYSDITRINGQKGHVDKLFFNAEHSLSILNSIRNFYQNISHGIR